MALATRSEVFTENEWLEVLNELSLSPRQSEVIKSLFHGLSDKQIARELQISVPTLRTYLNRIFTKFEVQDRVELVLYVVSQFREGCRSNGCHRF
ncbi:MAG: response regulator transcription factor [Planctomycetota bacterium]|jgi:DNA-binding NarL/FixJ family response regulator